MGSKTRVFVVFRRLFESWHDFLREAAEEVAVEGWPQGEDDFGRPGVRIFTDSIADRPCAVGEDRARDLLLDDGAGTQPNDGPRERNIGDRDQRKQDRDVARARAAADPTALVLDDLPALPDPVGRDAAHRVPAVPVARD